MSRRQPTAVALIVGIVATLSIHAATGRNTARPPQSPPPSGYIDRPFNADRDCYNPLAGMCDSQNVDVYEDYELPDTIGPAFPTHLRLIAYPEEKPPANLRLYYRAGLWRFVRLDADGNYHPVVVTTSTRSDQFRM